MKLAKIQQGLKAPKGQFNKFGNFSYRSCEDILTAVKPLLDGAILTLTDEVVSVGDRIYVKATATLTDGKESFSCSAFAREPAEKKGMDASQITGAASSYARKYALNGLFAIDDAKDADADDRAEPEAKKEKDLSGVIKALSKCIEIKDITNTLDIWLSLDDDGKKSVWNTLDDQQRDFIKQARGK